MLNETDLLLSEFSFERLFDDRGAIQWMQANWSKSFVFSALYAALVFGGRHYMKPRPKMNLRLPLVLWSLGLALFRLSFLLKDTSTYDP